MRFVIGKLSQDESMKSIVITGSTRGIGLGLADAFLARGCQVMISGREQASVDRAVSSLAKLYPAGQVAGQACDVSDFAQVERLWAAAAARFGKIDIWINNAGIGNTPIPFWELSPAKMQQVVNTNVLGAMYGSAVALRGMRKQGSGSLYNMEGYGSRDSGRLVNGLALYGTTKAALAFLNTSLIDEVKNTPVIVGRLQPGMVVTDLLTTQRTGDPAEWERSKRVFNILADRVETVTPWLAERVLSNTKNGARISWINPLKIFFRFLTAPVTKRKVID
jgi:NAD(P)-dependent dehydrogenase (short-subunit alcohol dehydrogenase family)